MLADEEARKGLMVMVNSVASADDLLAWMDYLSLPADGWEGDGEVPDVELSASVNQPVLNSFSPLSFIVPKAYAGKKFKKFKVNGKLLGRVFKKFVEDAGGEIDSGAYFSL
jgi:hypothetical protein